MFKLSNKLLAILFCVLLFFTISFSLCFAFLFLQYSHKVESNRIETRAMTLADTLSKSTPGTDVTSIYNNDTMYILNTFNQNEVWLIDKDSLQMTGSISNPALSYSLLPNELQAKINTVLDGGSIRTDSFAAASFIKSNYITVGVPVYDSSGQVKAALLLHSSLPKIDYGWYNGIEIMIFCLIVIFICSAILLRRLVKKHVIPLSSIRTELDKLIQGNYSINFNNTSRDEIGLLAGKINQLAVRLNARQESEHKKEQFCRLLIKSSARQLQNPLNSLQSDLLKVSDLDLKIRLQQNAKKINSVLSYLNELTLLDSPQLNLDTDLINLLEVLKTSITGCRSLIERKHLKLILQIQPKIMLFSGDFDRLKQMFDETIKQAVQLYPDSSIFNISINENNSCFYIQFAHSYAKDCLPVPNSKQDVSPLALALVAKIADLHNIEFKYEQQSDFPLFAFTIEK